MYARAVDDASVRLHELRREELQDFGLAALAFGLALAATQLRPAFAMPLFLGGVAVGALAVRALWRHWDLVDRLAGDRDAYVISDVLAYASRETTNERRHWFAAVIRSVVSQPGPAVASAGPHCRGRSRSACLGAGGRGARTRSRVRCRLRATGERSQPEPAPQSGATAGGAVLARSPDSFRFYDPRVAARPHGVLVTFRFSVSRHTTQVARPSTGACPAYPGRLHPLVESRLRPWSGGRCSEQVSSL